MRTLLERLTPVNLAAEREKFLADTSYNPQFVYPEEVTKEELEQYGLPEEELVRIAKRKVLGYVHRKEVAASEKVLTRADMEVSLSKLCEQLKIPLITLKIDEKLMSTAKLRRRPEQIFFVNAKPMTEKKWQHLLDHEIQTHYLRFYNGHENFLGVEEEEGLALINGQLARDEKVFYKAWLNYLAVALSLEKSFAQTFQELRPYFVSDEDAFKATLRAKRGLSDTSEPGAFTKDILYIKGSQRVAKWILQGGEPRELYQNGEEAVNGGAATVYPTFFVDMAEYKKQVARMWQANMNEVLDFSSFSISTRLILEELRARGAKISLVPATDLLEVNCAEKVAYFRAQMPLEKTSLLAHYATENKQMTKYFLEKAGVRAARWQMIVRDEMENTARLATIWEQLGKNVVLKPYNGAHGDDVLLNIVSSEDFVTKCQKMLTKYPEILAEEMVAGTEYRLTVAGGELLAVTNRVPANVVGDGEKNIKELIAAKNVGRGETWYDGGLRTIKIDDETRELLAEQKVTLLTVPPPLQKIVLKRVSNASAGGDSVIIENWHPTLQELARRIFDAIPGLAFAGIDLLCEKPRENIWQQAYCVVEINDSPGLMLAQLPAVGEPVNVAKSFVDVLLG